MSITNKEATPKPLRLTPTQKLELYEQELAKKEALELEKIVASVTKDVTNRINLFVSEYPEIQTFRYIATHKVSKIRHEGFSTTISDIVKSIELLIQTQRVEVVSMYVGVINGESILVKYPDLKVMRGLKQDAITVDLELDNLILI